VTASVLDSWAMIGWLQGEEPARAKVCELLEQALRGETKVSISLINVGEVFHLIAKRHRAAPAERFLADLAMMPIQALLPDRRLILGAARLKSRYPNFLRGRVCRGNGPGAKRHPGDWRPRTVATLQTRAHRTPLGGQEASPLTPTARARRPGSGLAMKPELTVATSLQFYAGYGTM